jgi:hypothetical protein
MWPYSILNLVLWFLACAIARSSSRHCLPLCWLHGVRRFFQRAHSDKNLQPRIGWNQIPSEPTSCGAEVLCCAFWHLCWICRISRMADVQLHSETKNSIYFFGFPATPWGSHIIGEATYDASQVWSICIHILPVQVSACGPKAVLVKSTSLGWDGADVGYQCSWLWYYPVNVAK